MFSVQVGCCDFEAIIESQDCGLLWWILDDPRGFAARGCLDTNLYVFPDRNLVVVRTQGKPRGREGNYEAYARVLFRRMTSS